jgi:hypothetical protein
MSQGYPHIVSRVNGMKIPLLAGQAGILHRFEHPENRVIIASTSYDPINDSRDDAAALVVPSSSAPEATDASPTAAAAPVNDEVAQLRAQLAAQAEQLAAAQAAAAKPAKAKAAKPAAPAPVEGGVL